MAAFYLGLRVLGSTGFPQTNKETYAYWDENPYMYMGIKDFKHARVQSGRSRANLAANRTTNLIMLKKSRRTPFRWTVSKYQLMDPENKVHGANIGPTRGW